MEQIIEPTFPTYSRELFEQRRKEGNAFLMQLQAPAGAILPSMEIPDVWHDVVYMVFSGVPASVTIDEGEETATTAEVDVDFPTTFYAAPDGIIFFYLGERRLRLGKDGTSFPELWGKIKERNERFGIAMPPDSFFWSASQENEGGALVPSDTKHCATSDTYTGRTDEAATALFKALSDGPTGLWWSNSDPQEPRRIHHRPKASHRVEIRADVERSEGLEALEQLTSKMDFDHVQIIQYVLEQIAPPPGFGWVPNPMLRAEIDIDDVIRRTITTRRGTAQEMAALRRKVVGCLEVVARAEVIGIRGGKPIKDDSGAVIQTKIDAPLWMLGGRTWPEQRGLFPEADTPISIEVALTLAWAPLLTDPVLSQYLPSAQILGSIKPTQAAGAWARALGQSLINLWRRHPREAVNGTLRITREEYLTAFTPKPFDDDPDKKDIMASLPGKILESRSPKRARDYWDAALSELVQREFISGEGEPRDCRLTQYPRQGWQRKWWKEMVLISPGRMTLPYVVACAERLPIPRIKDYSAPTRKKYNRKKAD